MMEGPNEEDRKAAETLVNYFDNLDALGSFAGEDTREGRLTFAALAFRNHRLGLNQ